MALEHILLGYLSRGPRTGYDLKKQFDVSAAHFWPARQNQIYRTLTRLHEDGYISREIVEQSGKPDRKVYEITNEGERMLLGWLSEPFCEPVWRSNLLGQLFFSGAVKDETVISLLEERARHLREELGLYEGLIQTKEEVATPEEARDQFFRWLTLDHGIQTHRRSIAWVEDAIARIRNKTYRKGKAGALRVL